MSYCSSGRYTVKVLTKNYEVEIGRYLRLKDAEKHIDAFSDRASKCVKENKPFDYCIHLNVKKEVKETIESLIILDRKDIIHESHWCF